MNKRAMVTNKQDVNDNILIFKRKNVNKPLTFMDKFKDIVRKYYSQEELYLIIAAIYDTEVYNEMPEHIQYVVDVFYKFKPKDV